MNDEEWRNINMFGLSTTLQQQRPNVVYQEAHGPSIPSLVAPNGMVLTFELVSPELAAQWLTKNKCNRAMRKHMVNAYARDMADNNWKLIPHAAAFLEDGSLGNAQHTLSAIVQSGKAQWLLIARNVPKDCIAVMDRGITRTITDISIFLGENFESKRAAIARVCDSGFPSSNPSIHRKLTFHENLAVYNKHKDQVDFAYGLADMKRNAGINATMLGVIARASYTQDLERLAQFVQIVRTGMVDNASDQAAIRYRDWARGESGAMRVTSPREIYKKSQTAIKAFLERRALQVLRGAEGDYFLIPGQDD